MIKLQIELDVPYDTLYCNACSRYDIHKSKCRLFNQTVYGDARLDECFDAEEKSKENNHGSI